MFETITPYTAAADLPAKAVLTERDVCTLLKKTPEALKGWRKKKTGPASFKLGESVCYYAGEVARWLDAQAAA